MFCSQVTLEAPAPACSMWDAPLKPVMRCGLLSCRRLLCFKSQASSAGCQAGLGWGPRSQGAVLPLPRDFLKPCTGISFLLEAWT